MPNSSNNNNNNSNKPRMSSTPITRAPVYSAPSMWDNIKMGFGASMGSRIFNGIFGDPTVNVKVDQMPPAPVSAPVSAPVIASPVTASLATYNKCDYLKDEIKFNKCDNEELNSNKCDELFRQMYKCQHSL